MEKDIFNINKNQLSYGRGYVYSLQYHLVWCTKYRKKVLKDRIDLECKKMLQDLAEEYRFQILAMEVMPDHHHHYRFNGRRGRGCAAENGRRACVSACARENTEEMRRTAFAGGSSYFPAINRCSRPKLSVSRTQTSQSCPSSALWLSNWQENRICCSSAAVPRFV